MKGYALQCAFVAHVHWCFHSDLFPKMNKDVKRKTGHPDFYNGFMLAKYFSIIRSDGVHFYFDKIQ